MGQLRVSPECLFSTFVVPVCYVRSKSPIGGGGHHVLPFVFQQSRCCLQLVFGGDVGGVSVGDDVCPPQREVPELYLFISRKIFLIEPWCCRYRGANLDRAPSRTPLVFPQLQQRFEVRLGHAGISTADESRGATHQSMAVFVPYASYK